MNWSKIKNKVFHEKISELDGLFNEVSENISNIKVARSKWTKPIENWTIHQITCNNSFKLNLEEYSCIKNIIEKINEDLIYSNNTFNDHRNKFRQSYFEMLCKREDNLKLEIASELVEEKKLPLEIFTDWYLLNCNLPPEQFNESLGKFWGNVWDNAKKGAASGGKAGSFAGTGLGAGLGGLAGGLYGGGKHLLKKVWDWHKGKSEFERTKEQALDALKKLKNKSSQFALDDNFKAMLDSMIEKLGTTKAHRVAPVPTKPSQTNILPDDWQNVNLSPLPNDHVSKRTSSPDDWQNVNLKPLANGHVSKRISSPEPRIASAPELSRTASPSDELDEPAPVAAPAVAAPAVAAPAVAAPAVAPEPEIVKPKRITSPETIRLAQAGRERWHQARKAAINAATAKENENRAGESLPPMDEKEEKKFRKNYVEVGMAKINAAIEERNQDRVAKGLKPMNNKQIEGFKKELGAKDPHMAAVLGTELEPTGPAAGPATGEPVPAPERKMTSIAAELDKPATGEPVPAPERKMTSIAAELDKPAEPEEPLAELDPLHKAEEPKQPEEPKTTVHDDAAIKHALDNTKEGHKEAGKFGEWKDPADLARYYEIPRTSNKRTNEYTRLGMALSPVIQEIFTKMGQNGELIKNIDGEEIWPDISMFADRDQVSNEDRDKIFEKMGDITKNLDFIHAANEVKKRPMETDAYLAKIGQEYIQYLKSKT
jgi:hypothetical protein